MKSVYILGVNGYPGVKCHDGSAAILKDGVVLAAAEQERFSRRKHAVAEAPYDAIKFCLQKTGLSLDNINYIATGWSEDKNLEVIPRGQKSWEIQFIANGRGFIRSLGGNGSEKVVHRISQLIPS